DRPDPGPEQLVQLLGDRAPVGGVHLGRGARGLDRVTEVEQAQADPELRHRDLEAVAPTRVYDAERVQRLEVTAVERAARASLELGPGELLAGVGHPRREHGAVQGDVLRRG